jgi:Flp pilus assembly protein TadD
MAAGIQWIVFSLSAVLLQANQVAAPKAARDPLSMGQVLVWMDGGTESLRVALLVELQSIDFVPTAEFLDSLRALHAKTALLEKLKNAKTVRSAADPTKEQAAYSHLLACLQKADSGTDAEAEKECSNAETEEPSTAQFALGLLAKRRGNAKGAVDFFKAAVKAAPRIPDNHNYLGLAFANVHDAEKAEAEYREAMRMDPDYETPVSNLANLFLKQGDFKSATRYARQAIAISSQDPYAHSSLGIALCKLGECSEGLEESRTAEKLDSENPEFHRSLAALLESNRDYNGALQEYRQVDRLRPEDVHVHKRMLIVLLGLGRKEEAAQECEKVRIWTHQKSCREVLQQLLAEGREAVDVR